MKTSCNITMLTYFKLPAKNTLSLHHLTFDCPLLFYLVYLFISGCVTKNKMASDLCRMSVSTHWGGGTNPGYVNVSQPCKRTSHAEKEKLNLGELTLNVLLVTCVKCCTTGLPSTDGVLYVIL